MIRARDLQPSLWDTPPAPKPPAPTHVDGVAVCLRTGCPREAGFVRDTRDWWVCGSCRQPTAGYAAMRLASP